MALTDQAILDFIAVHPSAGRDAIRKGVAPNAGEMQLEHTAFGRLNRMVA